MDPLDYLRLIRRRWYFIVIPVVLAVAAAVVTTPKAKQFASVKGYTATHTLLQGTDVTEPPNYDRLQLFTTAGTVPIEAAKILHSNLPPAVLASRVQAVADAKVGSLTITVTGPNGEEDARIANAFAEAVKNFLLDQAKQDRLDAINAAQARVDQIAAEIQKVQAQIAHGGNPVILGAQRDARAQRYQAAFSNLLTLQESPPSKSALDTLQAATPVPTLSGGFTAPTSKRGRVLIALLLSLVLSLAVVILVDRFDTRLRNRDRVEDVTRLPVLAEVPLLTRAQRKTTEISTADDPGGAVAEAYRTLRASLLFMPALSHTTTDATTGLEVHGDGQAVLITSPNSGDGKTTSAVNLAVAMAEAGHSVLVLDCDFRRPRAHSFLGVSPGRGLSDLLADDSLRIESLAQPTRIPGVQLITAGTTPAHPAALVAQVGPLVAEARAMADMVIVDCAPLLTVSDATDLVPYVDTVMVVIRAGKTTTEAALRSAERLHRLGVETAGIALLGSAGADRSAYYSDLPTGSLATLPAPVIRPRRKAEPAAPAVPAAPAAPAEPAAPAGQTEQAEPVVDVTFAANPLDAPLPPQQDPPAEEDVAFPAPSPTRMAPPPMARPVGFFRRTEPQEEHR